MTFMPAQKLQSGIVYVSKKEESHYWSDRVPEALGRGGRLIMPQIDAVSEMYNHRVPMYEWGNFEHLEKIIQIYLENQDDKTLQSEIDFTQKETADNHTYVNRVQTILKEINNG